MYWITGANGLLGSALQKVCKAALHTGREVDISDLGVLRKFAKEHPGIRYIINAAAYSLVDAAEKEREAAWKANAVGPGNLGQIANEIGAKFIHLSTDYVFPGNLMRPLSEVDVVAPCNYYGETKLEGERRALSLGALVIRTSWLFGGGGKNFVAKILQMLQSEKEICLTENQWGRSTYAPDLVEAILQIKDMVGLFQFANRGVVSRYEFGVAMKEEALKLGYKIVNEKMVPVPASAFPTPCKRPVYSAFDTAKIEQHILVRHWKEALRDFLCAQIPVCS